MDFSLTDEQLLIQDSAKEFAESVLAPVYEQIEKTGSIDDSIVKQMGECGFAGLPYAVDLGGAGADYLSYVLVLEQIGRYSRSVGSILANNNLAVNCIDKFGTDEQRHAYIPDCLTLEKISSFAFTEPSTGSDPKSIEATAVLDGDSWVLNGTKRFISLANYEGPMVVFAKDNQSDKPSAFIVDKFCEGYSLDEDWQKVGLHGAKLNDIVMNNIRIPKENILLGPGKGYQVLQANIAFGKLSVVALALGAAQGALECAMEYSVGRTRRGVPIWNYPTMQHRIADMAARVESIRMMVYRMAWIAEMSKDYGVIARESAKTKIIACEGAIRVCQDAMQCCGSYGATVECRVEGMMRDAVLLSMVEGVDDVQHVIVAHALGVQ